MSPMTLPDLAPTPAGRRAVRAKARKARGMALYGFLSIAHCTPKPEARLGVRLVSGLGGAGPFTDERSLRPGSLRDTPCLPDTRIGFRTLPSSLLALSGARGRRPARRPLS